MVTKTKLNTIPTKVVKAFDREAASLANLGVSSEKIIAFRNQVFNYFLNHTVEETNNWMKLEASFQIMSSSDIRC